jgi:hypothetical protein
MMVNAGAWPVALVTVFIVCLCVLTHYEALSLAGRLIRAFSRPRRRMLLIIVTILLAHIVEVWLFAFGYYVMVEHYGFGSLSGLDGKDLPDHAYYSAVVFSTLGFGDIIPHGAIRFMTGTEALTGLVLITWSASFAFLEMQRNWRL